MKKNIFLILFAYIFFLGVCIGQNPFTIANEKASNYSPSLLSGKSGGSGFGSNNWVVNSSGYSIARIAGSPLSNKSFLIRAGDDFGGSTSVSRILDSSLSNGDIFSIKFAADSPATGGSFTISLTDSSNNSLISLSYSSGDSSFVLNDGGADINTNISFSSGTEFIFSVTYLGSNDYSYSINGTDSSSITATNSLNIDGFKITATDLNLTNNSFNEIGFDNIQVDSSILSSNQTIFNTDVSLIDLTINSGATLTINSTGSLNVSDDFINNGSIVMNSTSNEFSSLITSSVSGSGTFTYNRYVSDTSNFDIVSAPFTGQTFSNLLSNNSGIIYDNPSDATQYVYGPFNNNTGAYVQYDSDTDGDETMDAGLGFRTGTDIGGFVTNPSFEDGSVGTMTKNVSLNNWMLGGGSSDATGVSASIQSSNVHNGDGSNALEVTSLDFDEEWAIRLINTSYPFNGDGTNSIDVTVSFWAKTSDTDPGSEVAAGDMRLLIKDTGSGNLGDKTERILLTTNSWVYVKKTLTFPAAADYSLSLYLEFGKVAGVTQIDGIKTSVSGGASLGTLAFTGTFETSNVTEPISLGTDATYGRWNLIGNPFPSYLDLDDFFTNNTGNLESGTTNGVYAYDGDDSDGSVWTIYNGNNSSGQYIAPGQAFFVASDSQTDVDVSFNTSWQSVSGTDDFLPGERRPNDDSFAQNASSSNSKISLALSFDDSKYAATDIYLNTKASSGLDVGYDAGTFANQAGSLGLYSFLADGSHPETKLAIQAVSNNISDPVVIPLGVNAQSGIDYTIKLKERPQQEGVFIYLKDKLDNSMTLLTDQDYSFNTSTDLQGDGRFEVHLSAFALSTFDISKAPYSMIGLSGKVQVTGELSKGDVITILDLRGRTLAKQTVNSPTQSTTVQLNGVSKGVYIGKVENNIGQYNTKFILK